MFVLILKIAAGISLLPFLLAFIMSVRIRLRIPPYHPSGIPWDKVALYGEDGSVKPASSIIGAFKKASTGLIFAVGMIVLGFVSPLIQPQGMFKNPDMDYYMTFGIGFVAGWLCFLASCYYGKLVRWNILYEKPPGMKR